VRFLRATGAGFLPFTAAFFFANLGRKISPPSRKKASIGQTASGEEYLCV
jgi:hypothetical protein